MEHTALHSLGNCPICGCPESLPGPVVADFSFSQSQFQLRDCTACSFRYTDPRPTENDIAGFYDSPDYISHTNSSKTLLDRLYKLARELAIRKKSQVVSTLCRSGKVLDLGCGTGEFLNELKSRGYSVTGVEPNKQAALQAQQLLGLNIYRHSAEIPGSARFHVITLWHVLEHLHDPISTLASLREMLLPGGSLIIAVPDRESWDAHHYGAFWAAWDVPRHLSHFRRKDVARLFRTTGFSLVKQRPMWMDAFYISILSEKYRGRSGLVSLLLGPVIGLWSNLVSLFSDRPTSSTLFIARRD